MSSDLTLFPWQVSIRSKEQNSKQDLVKVAKEALPFRKSYKQTYTNEVFDSKKIVTLSPPAYNLHYSHGDTLQRLFHQ